MPYVLGMQPFHLTLASAGRITLFPEPDALLNAVRVLARVGGPRLLLFSVVDDHVHVVLHAEASSVSRAASGLSRALAAAGAPDLARAHLRPVDGRSHLETLVSYLVKQPQKHGILASATWPGTCAPDLLGARVLPGFDPTAIARALPRADVPALVRRALGDARRAPLDAWHAAHAAAGAVPGERGPRGVAARVVWSRLALDGHVPERTHRWLRAQPVDAELLAATMLALALSGRNPDHGFPSSGVLPQTGPADRFERQDRLG